MITFPEWFQKREKKGYTEDVEAAWNASRVSLGKEIAETETASPELLIKAQYILIQELEQKLAESEKMRFQNQDAAVTNLGSALELNQRLSDALEVIRFYGSPQSWSYPGNDFHDFQIAKEDISECAWSAKSGKLMRGRKAGKRAREFMKKHGVEDETI